MPDDRSYSDKGTHVINIDQNKRKRKHTLIVCRPLINKVQNSLSLINDMEQCQSMPTETRSIPLPLPLVKADLKKGKHNKDTCVPATNEKNADRPMTICDSNISNQCSSAKQSRKMNQNECNWDDRGFSYTWKQTEIGADIIVKLKASPESLKKFDATFTSKTANILLSDEERHSIHLYDSIIKEKSRVEIKNGNAILSIMKKRRVLWPCLEVNSDLQANNVNTPENVQMDNIESDEGKENISLKKTSNSVVDKDTEFMDGNNAHISGLEEKEADVNDSCEKPVYRLDHLKNDFFERDSLLTLQVFVKCQTKDAVNVNFHKNGFVLKFQTSDDKFLKLHEGTSSETSFSWTVTTRGEIKPECCTFKVKPTVIEACLHKISSERWASLEAPSRKNNDISKPNTWLPLNALSGKATPASPSSSSLPTSSSSSASNGYDENKQSSKNSSVFFGDLSDVDLKDKGKKAANYNNQNQISNDSGLSAFSENLRFKATSSHDFNKPTAKVPPLTKERDEIPPVVSPGYAGLVNLGNTCFMNCVLQVMANTKEFRDYFLDGRFQHEINEDNPLGMKGHLATTFGALLRWMWSCKRYCWEPRKLKDLISKKNPQFFGFAQHDAHEFLAFLLDGLHEDLNRIKKKPYTETVDSNGRPDEVVAAEAWAQYKKRNDSVVVDMFQGQYKSKLVCPKCGKVSITFDPFLYLSVPLPKKMKIIPVTFMWKEFYKKPHMYHIQVSQDSTIESLLDILSQKTSVATSDIRVFETYKGKIHKFFMSGASLTHVDAKDIIIACEMLSEELAGEEVLEIPVMQRTLLPTELPTRCAFCHKVCLEGTVPLKRCTKCYKVGYCDHSCQRNHWNVHKSQCSTSPEIIGCPFILSIPASRATYSYLVKLMEGFARFSVNIFQPPVKPMENASNPPTTTTAVNHTTSTSNLSSSLSQSCSSLNSLDSLSSASSTCTLTGDQSDPQIQDDGQEAVTSASSISCKTSDSMNAIDTSGDGTETASKSSFTDSGIDTASIKSEKVIPTSQVMGVQVLESERDKATATFFIKPVTMEGVGVKGAERLEDKGDTVLELSSHRFLSMDWRNNGRQQSCVLVQAKELEAKKVDDWDDVNKASNKPTLYQCLELFTEPEILKPEEAWYCPTCKKHVEASKQMAIWQLPHTLIIQLKRFSFQNFLLRSKIKKHVDFPTRGLDLRRFCASTSTTPGSPPIYDLYGVANHHGLLIGGHYTSFARCVDERFPGTDEVSWRLCDDSRVSAVSNEGSVVTSDAYLLFYRRRGMPATIATPSRLVSVSPTTSPRIIPTSVTVNDDSSEDSGYDYDFNNSGSSGSMEEVDFNEAASFSSSSVTASNVKNTNFNDRVELLNMKQGGKGTPDDSAVIMNKDVPHQKVVNSEEDEGEDDFDEELREKGDKEKEFKDWWMKDEDQDRFYSDDDDSGDDKERRLVIDTSEELGYTDMEAVD